MVGGRGGRGGLFHNLSVRVGALCACNYVCWVVHCVPGALCPVTGACVPAPFIGSSGPAVPCRAVLYSGSIIDEGLLCVCLCLRVWGRVGTQEGRPYRAKVTDISGGAYVKQESRQNKNESPSIGN